MSDVFTGFVIDVTPETFVTVFGCVEELRAFPERMWLGGKRSRLEPVYFNRIMKARKALAAVRWLAFGDALMALPLDCSNVDTSEARLNLANALEKAAKALDDFEVAIHSTWAVERAAVERMVEKLGVAQLESVPAEKVGAL